MTATDYQRIQQMIDATLAYHLGLVKVQPQAGDSVHYMPEDQELIASMNDLSQAEEDIQNDLQGDLSELRTDINHLERHIDN